MKKHFNEKSFTFFTINFIVGFGFITVIQSLIDIGLYGILVFVITSFIILGVGLVYSRLSNSYNNEYGGTYYYSKQVFNKSFSFYMGWNQYIQGPVLSATAPLFIASASEYLTNNEQVLWILRITSIIFFILLVLVSTLGLHINKILILISSIIKWIILILGLGITIYLVIDNFNNNFINISQINPYLIFSNILSFIYAFGGYEDVSSMSKDVQFKNFRKILITSFLFIFILYAIFYTLIQFINIPQFNNFIQIYQIGLGLSGSIIFVVGLIFNSISARLSVNLTAARKLISLVNDGYLFSALSKTNKRGEYKNAIYFNALLTIGSMLIFWLIPYFLNLNNFFEAVINVGSIAFLIQYMFTFIIALVLYKKKKLKYIKTWELIIYYVSIVLISVVLLIYVFPFIIGSSWSIESLITIISYILFILGGFIIYFINSKTKKLKIKE